MTSSDSTPPQDALPPPSRADWWYAVAAWVSSAFAAAWLGIALAAFMMEPFMGVMLAMICGPFATLLLKHEYCALHYQEASAACWAGRMLLAAAAMNLLAMGSAIAEVAKTSLESLPDLLIVLALPLSFVVLTLVLTMVHFRWRHRLQSAEPCPPAARQFTIREVLGLFALLSIFLGTAAALVRNQPIAHGLHLTPEQADLSLPAGASDVCIQRYGRGTMTYEFATDEAGYRQWIANGIGSLESQASETMIEPIQSPIRVRRVLPPGPGTSGMDWMTVCTGLEYYWEKEDRAVHAVYDPTRQRAFYNQHFH